MRMSALKEEREAEFFQTSLTSVRLRPQEDERTIGLTDSGLNPIRKYESLSCPVQVYVVIVVQGPCRLFMQIE